CFPSVGRGAIPFSAPWRSPPGPSPNNWARGRLRELVMPAFFGIGRVLIAIAAAERILPLDGERSGDTSAGHEARLAGRLLHPGTGPSPMERLLRRWSRSISSSCGPEILDVRQRPATWNLWNPRPPVNVEQPCSPTGA